MINGPAYQEFIDATGPLANNVTSASWWHPAVRYKSKDVFGARRTSPKLFHAKYSNALPDFTKATGSAVGVVLQMAIEKAGTIDRDKVREVLAAGGFETFFGPITFNATGLASILHAAGLPDPGRQAGGDLSRRDQGRDLAASAVR